MMEASREAKATEDRRTEYCKENERQRQWSGARQFRNGGNGRAHQSEGEDNMPGIRIG